MIQWFSKADKSAVATINRSTITINKTGLDWIQEAYCCMLGYDEESNEIALRPLDKNKYDSGAYPKESLFVLSGGKTYTRVSSADFISIVSKHLCYDYRDGAKKYACRFDEEHQVLLIDLKKEVN